MSDGTDSAGAEDHSAGLCARCRHMRPVSNRRGSRFYLCERSRNDSRYPKYPGIPVRECAGFERRGAGASGAGEARLADPELGDDRTSDVHQEES